MNGSVSMPLVVNTVSSATSSGTTMTKAHTIATLPLQSNENGNSRSQARLTTTTQSRNDGQTNAFQIRAKKDSSSSSTISTDSAIVSATEMVNKKSTLMSTKPKPKMKGNNGSRVLNAESEKTEEGGGRDSSHYSTNKSGSSGYYSSNVCSTYSLEDHIYSEPVSADGVLDKVNTKSKSVILTRQNRNRTAAASKAAVVNASESATILKSSRSRDMHGAGTGNACAIEAEDEETDEADQLRVLTLKNKKIQGNSIDDMNFNENLRILETSIENLDRHLRNFPSLTAQERVAAFVQAPNAHILPQLDQRHIHHLPTIMEGYVPNSQPRSWTEDMADDSLMDIDLDSFLLTNEKHKRPVKTANGIDNPSFLADELEENNYKCAKYINSCPEDAYRVDSDIVTISDNSEPRDQFRQRYEDQIHFENTRELLEDVRDKIRTLSQTNANLISNKIQVQSPQVEVMPEELEAMIKALKRELETYLARINQHSDHEIRQLCTGIVKNQNVVRLTKAFERRRSEFEIGGINVACAATSGVPISITQQITSIRCASDPNFKMKRKSLAEVFPAAETYLKSMNEKSQQKIFVTPLQQQQQQQQQQNQSELNEQTQLQRNLSFHQPVLNHMNSKENISNILNVNTIDIQESANAANVANVTNVGAVSVGGNSVNSKEPAGDKDSILEWHRKKPSNWEMYYGTNRLSQSLLAAQRTNKQPNNSQATMSYVST